MNNITLIKDPHGKILGKIETDSKGNKTAKTYEGIILGFYKKDRDITTDWQGWPLANGDTVVSLIYSQE